MLFVFCRLDEKLVLGDLFHAVQLFRALMEGLRLLLSLFVVVHKPIDVQHFRVTVLRRRLGLQRCSCWDCVGHFQIFVFTLPLKAPWFTSTLQALVHKRAQLNAKGNPSPSLHGTILTHTCLCFYQKTTRISNTSCVVFLFSVVFASSSRDPNSTMIGRGYIVRGASRIFHTILPVGRVFYNN